MIADHDMLREMSRSYLQACEKYKQDAAASDGMDVGAIKGKFGKDDGEGKPWYKGKDGGKGKSWNPFGKTAKDDKGKGKFGKGKYKQGKDTKGGNENGDVNMKGSSNYYKAPANSQFQGERSHCGKRGHKVSECWRNKLLELKRTARAQRFEHPPQQWDRLRQRKALQLRPTTRRRTDRGCSVFWTTTRPSTAW